MKEEYKRYERWNPTNRLADEYSKSLAPAYIENMTQTLLQKTQEKRYGKFDF